MDFKNSYVTKIKNEEIKKFTILALEKYGDLSKFERANKVADIVWKKFVTLGYISADIQQQFVDITISAALLYNLFYDKNKISTLLKYRECLEELQVLTNLDERIANLV